MSTLKIFSYKGHVGCFIYLSGKFINDPTGGGQLGCIVHTNETTITKEAKEIIQNASRQGGSFSALMLTKHADGSGSSIGVMGFGGVYLGKGSDITIGRDCDKSVLDDCIISTEPVPQDFIEFIDENM